MAELFHALHFPFAIDASTGRLARERFYDDYLRGLIIQVLLTSPGERVNRPDFGAGLKRYVFSPLGDASASLAQTAVHQALDEWLGAYIRVESVTAAVSGESTLSVGVVFTVLAVGERRELNMEVAL
jgi:phage baseplate assembly protein W